jgi:hypothetical protein
MILLKNIMVAEVDAFGNRSIMNKAKEEKI